MEKISGLKAERSRIIKVRNSRGLIQELTPLAFQKKFGVEYTDQLLIDSSCSAETFEGVENGSRYAEQIRSGTGADVYIQKVSDEVGFGVFANENIEEEQLIGEYTGLARLKRDADCSNAYIFSYNKNGVVDARKRGNAMRFVNHSSRDPNAIYKRVLVDGVQHIIFVALRRIIAGEQIGFDYGEAYWQLHGAPQDI